MGPGDNVGIDREGSASQQGLEDPPCRPSYLAGQCLSASVTGSPHADPRQCLSASVTGSPHVDPRTQWAVPLSKCYRIPPCRPSYSVVCVCALSAEDAPMQTLILSGLSLSFTGQCLSAGVDPRVPH
ncbi:hypothetical protein Bbelb_029490 [Branchiostoma belcheri]|nr:hypothetical protein Bbelb_029490 [Branchiostoma belcheri]